MRNMLFISHANPEDNEFSLWLALQLANAGYPVWCDLTKLLGGEDFWNDAEEAIRERTIKFIYVLSKTSNKKRGPRQELQIAHTVAREKGLRDFIIPVRIDDLPHGDTNIQLASINAISFNQGKAQALNKLLEKLEQDKVSTNPNFSPSAVTSWWRTQFSPDKGISDQPEEYISNWFPITALPPNIFFHSLHRSEIGMLEIQAELPYPAFQHNQYLASFASADDFKGKLGSYMSISHSYSFPTYDFADGKVGKQFVDKMRPRDFVTRLLRIGWEKMLVERKLPTYTLSNNAMCFYFTMGMTKKDDVSFLGVDGKKTLRRERKSLRDRHHGSHIRAVTDGSAGLTSDRDRVMGAGHWSKSQVGHNIVRPEH